MNLTALDLTIISIPLLIVVAVSLYMKKFMHNVTDFLAASRCAGRYLISTANCATWTSVMGMVVMLEVFSRTGFSLRLWESFASILIFFFGLLGLVSYRFRQTRALTFHQFFELRYSKGLRVFSSFLSTFSGLFNFGIQPAVGARFTVYFCGLPEHFMVGNFVLPTYIPIMIILMLLSLAFALSGGQISVMVTDCIEGVISSIFYLAIAFFILLAIPLSNIKEALVSGAPGSSYIDPFDIGGRTDFSAEYLIIGMIISLYYYRGSAWVQGFAASAKSAHEGRMAEILSNWRSYASSAMIVLVSIGAFTFLHHPEYAAQQQAVEQHLSGLDNPQLVTQMRMPTALGIMLIPGIKGAFCAVLLFGLLASQGVSLHGMGSTILQDVIMPFRKTPFSPKFHLIALKLSVFCVAVFACLMSIVYKPVDYLVMITTLIGAIYLAGAGCVCWGGLYWKKGTTAGAWSAMIIGFVLGVGSNLLQQTWSTLDPWLVGMMGDGPVKAYLIAHASKFPLDGYEMTLLICACCAISYITVSLLTCREDFNLDQMLHRGKYKVEASPEGSDVPSRKRNFLEKFLDIDENFTKGDRVLTIGTFFWTVWWKVVAISILFWVLFISDFTKDWWFNYTLIVGIGLPVVMGVITTVWFTIGVSHDLIELLRTLKSIKRSDADDGRVVGHHNAGENGTPLK